MKHLINIAGLTFIEMIQGRVFQVLLFLTLAAPLLGSVLSALFMLDIGKVYMDGVMGVVHFASVVFMLFIAASVLARDIEQKICYFLVVPPASRESYLLGRFMGFLWAYLLVMLLLVSESVFVGELIFAQKIPVYVSGFTMFNMTTLIFLHAFQYVSVLGLVFFIASWASGLAEIIFFSTMGLVLSWIFPQILLVINQMATTGDSPAFLHYIFAFIYSLLPHLTGADISLMLTHGQSLGYQDIVVYLLEHIGYAGVLLGLAVWSFNKRDL